MRKSRSGIDTSHLACYHSFAIVPQTETQNAGKEMVNMKRLTALFLAAALALSLAACGSNSGSGSQSGDDTLDVSDENVVEATWQDVFDDVQENEARALTNTYKVTGSIDKIESDCCVVGALYVYLPSDVLASIDTDETPEITFIGKITNVGSAEGYYEGGAVIIEFGDAELVELH